ncbi:restriction endonuclease [Candidatus Kaiserbacteria bacterium]|nr:restriction endonuclease [Candidatus Kaiserbacteria bacterium]
MTEEILIKKTDGSTEAFDASKLEGSLKRAGASESIIKEIVDKVNSKLVPGMTTKEIYQDAFELLRDKEEKPIAAKYSLKKAVFELGPSGFPFEDFITEIFRATGHEASNGVIMAGKCAEHEVDMFAVHKGGKRHGAEIKFHNHPGIKTDLKVALYVHARFDDLIKGGKVDEGVLITNTRFTSNALEYGKCAGLKMISWNYPEKDNLYSLIEETGLHPITCLTTIPDRNKKILIDNEIVLCRSIRENASVLSEYGVPVDRIPSILEEVGSLCQPGAGV